MTVPASPSPVHVDGPAPTRPRPGLEALAAAGPELAPTQPEHEDGWWLTYPGGRRSGPVPPGMFDLDARLADMDRTGVTVQALSVPPTHFNYRVPIAGTRPAARLHNDAMRDMATAHPDRFVVLATLPMQDPDAAVAELERVAVDPAVVGVELGTNVDGRNLDDPGLEPVWAALAALGMGVVLHPADVVGQADRMHAYYVHNFVGNPTDTTVAAAALLFGGVLVRHPRLRVALLHGGGFLPYQIGRFDHGWRVRPEPRAHLDRPPSSLLDRFWFDTLTHDEASLRFLLDRVGAGRLLLGSDYPFDMADADPVATVRKALDGPVADRVAADTPRAFLTRLAPGS